MLSIHQILAQASEPTGLTPAGVVVMAVSLLIVLGLCGFCMARILGEKKRQEHQNVPLDIDIPDPE